MERPVRGLPCATGGEPADEAAQDEEEQEAPKEKSKKSKKGDKKDMSSLFATLEEDAGALWSRQQQY